MPETLETLDAHAIIKELAEAVLECRSGLAHDYGNCAAGCEDGYIFPFKALWMPCPCTQVDLQLSHLPYEEFPVVCKRCYIAGRHSEGCVCQGKMWVSEPDVERACWRLHEMGFEGETKEAVLRAAKTWLEGQR